MLHYISTKRYFARRCDVCCTLTAYVSVAILYFVMLILIIAAAGFAGFYVNSQLKVVCGLCLLCATGWQPTHERLAALAVL